MFMMISHRRYALILGGVFALLWIAMSIDPYDRKDWLLENVLTVLAVIWLVFSSKRLPFSRISYTLMFLFLCLHTVGSHYTYANVPYDEWWQSMFGGSLNSLLGWQRNNFDRMVHFSYGLLLAYPIREVFHRVVEVRGFWGYFLPLDVTMSTSMLYEIIEWGVAELFGGELGMAYLGTQGDIWDAHKDMGLASLGALIAMIVTALINTYVQRDFAREWVESLRVKSRRPLGEDEIKRLLKDKNDPSESN